MQILDVIFKSKVFLPLILKKIREEVEKKETPALINDEERLCSDCGSDIGLEYYEAFDDGYKEAIDDIIKLLTP